MLAEARSRGSRLVVALDSDAGVAALKGPGHPRVPFGEREAALLELRCVDEVVGFTGDDGLDALIRERRPTYLVKGDDHDPATLPGRAALEECGGEVLILPRLYELSSSELVEEM
jgi:D-beta-D-heptose 7-phosphate kinase/D-beta-D-heptose 1-phosphate adenosyltransferase